jgi:hypothetical protein
MATLAKPAADILNRRRAVAAVLASFGIEGLAPDSATSALLEQYAGGAITLEQFGAAIERHVAGMKNRTAV